VKRTTRSPSPQWEAEFYLGGTRRLGRISRAPDGRFVVVDSAANSVSSSSDDGGFLSRPGFRNRASWRRPLVGCPSDLSLRSSASGDSLVWTPRRGRTPLTIVPTIYTPRTTPFRASSPAASAMFSPVSPIWSPAYFSDLSSVRQSSSAERTLRSVREMYSQELPSLRAIHEENQRTLGRARGVRARLPPRHARHARSAPELAVLAQETSPESRSSSSGFGSKNTSQQTGSSGTGEWRLLPPYRPPPPPPVIRHWLEYTSEFPSPTQSDVSHKPLSVDDHYEFDPVYPISPTPTDMTRIFNTAHQTRTPKYDNIEARVQAMKEEFHAFKERQARRRQSEHLESVC